MKRLVILAVLVVLGWYAYGKYPHYFKPQREAEAAEVVRPASRAAPSAGAERPGPASFTCDGRTHCSQMTSCAEATYFLRNCPGTKMDGNHDGIPCEKQWCK